MQEITVTNEAAEALPILKVAEGILGSKDGRGIGDLADPLTIEEWTNTYLAGRGVDSDSTLAAAFRFGVGAEGRYAGQSFVEAEPELRADWSSEKNRQPWDAVQDAVWSGFDRARNRHLGNVLTIPGDA